MRAFRVLILGALAAAVCLRLGFWQVSRLRQREALRALVEARLARPPLPLTEVTARSREPVDSAAYRLASARGRFDFSRQVVVAGRSVNQVPGVYVVTPLLLADSQAILVERGWVPSPDAYTVALDSLGEPDSAAVTGWLLRVTARRDPGGRDSAWPIHVAAGDPERLARRYPYRLLPWVLRRAEAATAPPALRPLPAPVVDRGPHLSYAIQWFAFAIIALVGSALLVRRDRRSIDFGRGGEQSRG